jgi:hypothetical protein
MGRGLASNIGSCVQSVSADGSVRAISADYFSHLRTGGGKGVFCLLEKRLCRVE